MRAESVDNTAQRTTNTSAVVPNPFVRIAAAERNTAAQNHAYLRLSSHCNMDAIAAPASINAAGCAMSPYATTSRICRESVLWGKSVAISATATDDSVAKASAAAT